MLSADQARRIILEHSRFLGSEKIPTLQSQGRYLADEVKAPMPLPSFDNAAMDGFAIRALDVLQASENNPVTLKVIKRVVAGDNIYQHCVMPLGHGQAVRIMTGAPVPEGADTVVPFEDVTFTETTCELKDGVKEGQHVRRQGEDVLVGDLVLSCGEKLDLRRLALLTAVGVDQVCVGRKPKIKILSTGNEIIPLGEDLKPGQIYNSNGPALVLALKAMGLEATELSIAVDTEEDLEKILQSLSDVDILLTVGGVSAGDLDLVPKVLKKLGAEPLFHKVSIKPGKPLLFCRWDQRLVFGLPGNPVSALMVFERFVRPALLQMQGAKNIFSTTYQAIMQEDLRASHGKEDYLRGHVIYSEGQFQAFSAGRQGSAHLKALASSNAILIVPESVDYLHQGDAVSFVFWGDS
ncbi:MAG: molybdopterin molybdotransferase MoeA [Deltaproteobacteria bacterium]|nr:MAG: molybdopterin molybdotransferase MoeA [Deltaproteobacteria bacterium]